MCCFSGRVQRVAQTRIFARSRPGGRQLLAYQMRFSADADLAMILPLPAPRGSAEESVRFIALEAYPRFFEQLAGLFPAVDSMSRGLPQSRSAASPAPLRVHDVGSFEASFVPTVADFARLDARFRLPDSTWDQLPGYRDYGFAVFKLKRGSPRRHPMAFEFPRADPTRLFFPTVHVHDGAVHPTAHFDHTLYCQVPAGTLDTDQREWEASAPIGTLSRDALPTEFLDLAGPVYRRQLTGQRKNEDIRL